MGAEQRPSASRKLRLGLYVIPDAEIGRGSLVEQTEAALAGGADVIQLRAKHLSTRALLEVGAPMQAAARAAGALFIVNDRVDVALALAADGVHVGDDDMPVAVVRRLVGPAMIVGASAGTPAAARAAWEAGADYLGVGPVFPTASKADAGEAIGPVGLAAVAAATPLPVVGIGGISAANVTDVIRAGAAGAAVISAVVAAPDIVDAAADLCRRIEAARPAGG